MSINLLFADSFSTGSATVGFPQKWFGPPSSGGTPALSSPSPSGGQYLSSGYGYYAFPSAPSAMTFGVRFKSPSLPSGATKQVIVALTDDSSGDAQSELWIDASGNLMFGSIFASSSISASAVISAGVWYYAEVSVSSISGSPVACVIKLNSSTVATGSCITNGYSANTTTYGFVVNSLGVTYICDVYIDGTAANYYAVNANGVFVAPLLPTGAGQTTAWTPNGAVSNYLCVNNNPPQPGTKFVSSSTDTQVDLYALAALPGAVSSVLAVQVFAYDNTTSSTGTVSLGVGNGSSSHFGSAEATGTAAKYLLLALDTNPLTSSAWATADFSTLQSGIKKVS